jgi:hypothetical protein
LKNLTKQWISLSLLSLMLVKVWVIPLLYLDFEVRRDYIIANLCENRARPQMNCNGKCYLAKRIATLEEQEKRQAEKSYMARLLDHAMDHRTSFSFLPPMLSFEVPHLLHFPYSSLLAAYQLPHDIFHPPLS